jgi:hypothetical protein
MCKCDFIFIISQFLICFRKNYFYRFTVDLDPDPHSLIGTVARDFRPSVFFIKQYPLGPGFTGLILFEFCFGFGEIWSIFERKNRACGVNDPACIIMHAVSLPAHVFLIFLHSITVLPMISLFEVVRKFYCACGFNDTACIFKILISSRIWIYIRKGFSPLIRGPGRMF